MNLGVFLAIGESIQDLKKKGQESLFVNNNLKNYSRNFTKVYVFSYANENLTFFDNVYILPNKYHIHRYLYALIGPLFHRKYLRSCAVYRAYQLTGIIPSFTAKALWGKKIVLNFGYPYEQIADVEGKTIATQVLKLVKNLLLPFSDTIIITQDFLKQLLPESLHPKTVLIPNSVDTAVFKPTKTTKKYTAVFVGRLEKQKNLSVLIKALSYLPPKNRSLLLIGHGSLTKPLQTLCKNFKVNLKLYSKIENNKLPQYLNQAKIFILPSAVEGHPKALLEAMSCGLACIGNNIPAIKEVFKNKSGLLYNGSVKDLEDKIRHLLRDSKLMRELGKKGRKRVMENYDFNKIARKEIALLKNI